MNLYLQRLLVNSLESGVGLVRRKVRVFRQFLTVIVRSVADGKGRRLATTKRNTTPGLFSLASTLELTVS
jgi:hypothetical protein